MPETVEIEYHPNLTAVEIERLKRLEVDLIQRLTLQSRFGRARWVPKVEAEGRTIFILELVDFQPPRTFTFCIFRELDWKDREVLLDRGAFEGSLHDRPSRREPETGS